jgi:hypothetical protein
MCAAIGLFISVKIHASDGDATGNGILPYRTLDRTFLIFKMTRASNVD